MTPVANLPPVSLVLLIPVANLPPVSTIPAANFFFFGGGIFSLFPYNIQHCFICRPSDSTVPTDAGIEICHWCQRHRWQTMGLISSCRYFKVNLKAKVYIYVNSTIQRCPNKIIKIFLIEDFFHLPPVSTTPVVNLQLRISPRIFEKIRNGPNGML